MFGKKVKIMTDIAGQEGMIGTVIIQGVDSTSKRNIYKVSIEPGQEGPQDSIIYYEEELQDITIDVKKEMAEPVEIDLSIAESIAEGMMEDSLGDFFTARPIDSAKAYSRRKSTIAHLDAWQAEINDNYSADMGDELEMLYSSALETLKTIISLETTKISEGK